MAALLITRCVERKLVLNETMGEACHRVGKLVQGDIGQMLLLQMLYPERAPLAWKLRA